eukprot:COSAG01_NODE_16623_length_1220_cov_1.064228_2_plen_108_part_00
MFAEAKSEAEAEADTKATKEADASTEETPTLGNNKEKLQGSIEAVAKADGGKELLAKAMSVVHKGKTVDEKTLGMIWDEFDIDTVCVPCCLSPGHHVCVCIRLSAYC